MNHNLKLNDDAAIDVLRAINLIASAVVAARALPGVSPEMLAYLGTIGDAAYVVDAIVFDTDAATDSEYAIGEGNDPVGVVRPTTALDVMLSLLDDGVIGLREFQGQLDPRGIDQRHPCIMPGCDYTVQFDDEPYCYTHSPDEGSSVRGYSYLMYARRAQQTADTVDGFVM